MNWMSLRDFKLTRKTLTNVRFEVFIFRLIFWSKSDAVKSNRIPNSQGLVFNTNEIFKEYCLLAFNCRLITDQPVSII